MSNPIRKPIWIHFEPFLDTLRCFFNKTRRSKYFRLGQYDTFWLLSECSLMIAECSLLCSWSESEPKRWWLRASDKLGSTDEQINKSIYWAPDGAKKNFVDLTCSKERTAYLETIKFLIVHFLLHVCTRNRFWFLMQFGGEAIRKEANFSGRVVDCI